MFSIKSTSASVDANGAGRTATIPAFNNPQHSKSMTVDPQFQQALDVASEVAKRYEISSLGALLASCRSAVSQDELSVAIIGRFKAGKSSFINHFIGRPVLPVGVIPVTTVITEIRYGPIEKAEAHFLDGVVQQIPVDEIGAYVSERENPENSKRVRIITLDLPRLERFRGLRFVDTPGLDSALAHNTEESMRWLPNVGLALVAMSVDPPLSQQDIELLKRVYEFTPKVAILLTKVDLLAREERSEVVAFIEAQLEKTFGSAAPVLPYSVRPGYEDLKRQLEHSVFEQTLAQFGEQRRAILARKIDTLLRECADYITLSLKSAELMDSEREGLKKQVIGQREVIADVKAELRLIAQHAIGATRTSAEARLQTHQKQLEDRLLQQLDVEFPGWTKSLAYLLESFERWLTSTLAQDLTRISLTERSKMAEPLRRFGKQIFRSLQDFRDRLSDGTMRAFGIPLRTTEVEMAIHEPKSPDIRIGKIFDRNWELLSPIMPVALIKPIVRGHFARQLPYILYTNLSRLASQWEESINVALLNMQKEAERRHEDLIGTVEHLIETGQRDRLPAIRSDLERIESARRAVADSAGSITT
jgi:GTP-binding protein EngB required for normal cell division